MDILNIVDTYERNVEAYDDLLHSSDKPLNLLIAGIYQKSLF